MPFLKTGKTQDGVPVLEGGLPGNFWERENAGRGTLSEGGLPGNFEEREKRRLEPIKKMEKRRGGYPFGRGFMGKNFEERKFYVIFVTNNKN